MTHIELYKKKAQDLRKIISPAKSVLIVTHDYPDPDCLASALGMQHLLKSWGIESTQIAFGGFVGRAENRAMIRFLDIKTMPLNLIELSDFERVILVDSFPHSGNVSLENPTHVDVVIDHHPHNILENTDFYCDIRHNIGSTSTIITQYLIAEEYDIQSELATALFYGIKTDTNYLSRNTHDEDIECYKLLFDIIDHTALSNIEAPERDAEYFRVLHRATESMMLYNHSIGHTHLGEITTPDYIAEIADLLHSLENMEWMLCTGIFKNQIFFSIRSRNEETAGIKAEEIARTLNGNGGGHPTMAAGRIPLLNNDNENLMQKFIKIYKHVLNIDSEKGVSIFK